MGDDVELEEVVALRECRAELEHLQVEYDALDAHHHRYATWAAREYLRSEKRGDTYRARALIVFRRGRVRAEYLNDIYQQAEDDFGSMSEIYTAERQRAERAESEAAKLRGLLERSAAFIQWLMGDGTDLGPEEYDRFIREIDAALAANLPALAATPDTPPAQSAPAVDVKG